MSQLKGNRITLEALARKMQGGGRLDDAARRIAMAVLRLRIPIEFSAEDAAKIEGYQAKAGRPRKDKNETTS